MSARVTAPAVTTTIETEIHCPECGGDVFVASTGDILCATTSALIYPWYAAERLEDYAADYAEDAPARAAAMRDAAEWLRAH